MPRPLDLYPLHPHAQLRPAPQEELVVVRPRVGPARDPPKAVQVELPLEARELGLSEVIAHDVAGEFLGTADEEGPAVGQPGDDGGTSDGLDVEHGHELLGEGDGDAARFLADVLLGVGDGRVIVVDVLDRETLGIAEVEGPFPWPSLCHLEMM